MVNEFYSYYYSFTKSDVVTLVETNYKTYISESVIQKARKIKEAKTAERIGLRDFHGRVSWY